MLGLTWQNLQKIGITIKDWSACSPDLNPIEHVWAIMKNRLEVLDPKDTQSFKDGIEKVWSELWNNGDLKYLIESMPSRIERCLKAKGAILNQFFKLNFFTVY